MARVDLAGVRKIFPNGVTGLDGIDLAVADAEIVVLVGPSGCGKSTLLRIVAGLEAPTAGTVSIDGRVVDDAPPQARNVAMVFQDYALYPHLSVRGNLEFPLRMRGLPPAERGPRIERTAALLDLGALLDRLPRELSGGQRQRVAMGRALVREPSVFLLDEPLSNLDAKLRGQVRAEIETLQRCTRTTMLYVTHDQTEAMTLGQRIAVLDHGRLRQVGTPQEVYERPADVFVAGFIGSPPMNLFPARIQGDGQALVGGQRISLGGFAGAARARAGTDALTIGVRPEALRLAAPGGDDVLTAATEHVEQLGHETLIHVRAGDVPLVVRAGGMHAHPADERVGVALDPAQLYFFDAAGAAVAGPSRTTA